MHEVIIRTWSFLLSSKARSMAAALLMDPTPCVPAACFGGGWTFVLPLQEGMDIFKKWVKAQKMPDGSAQFEWIEVES